jgi:hypothetical protein
MFSPNQEAHVLTAGGRPSAVASDQHDVTTGRSSSVPGGEGIGLLLGVEVVRILVGERSLDNMDSPGRLTAGRSLSQAKA